MFQKDPEITFARSYPKIKIQFIFTSIFTSIINNNKNVTSNDKNNFSLEGRLVSIDNNF